jgi:hypothetical protein
VRFGALQRFGFIKASDIQDLPHPEHVTLAWFGYHLSAFPKMKP